MLLAYSHQSTANYSSMRLRVILVILLLPPQDTLAFKQIGPWSDALTSSSKVNGAAASGFLRPEGTGKAVPEAEMQPNATYVTLQEMEEQLSRCYNRVAFNQLIFSVVAIMWPLWVMSQIMQDIIPYIAQCTGSHGGIFSF